MNQLINSNLQINISQLQQNQQSKSINVTRNLVQITHNQAKTDSNSKTHEEKENPDQKNAAVTSIDGNNERLNNSLGGKTNELGKQG